MHSKKIMTTTSKHIVSLIVALGVVLAVLLGSIISQSRVAVGSVNSTDAYKATTTTSLAASASVSYQACRGKCVIGSIVVVNPASAGWVQLWDATSTATSTYVGSLRSESDMGSSSPYTTLGRPIAQIMAASDVVNTLTLDVQTVQGLVIETSTGFDGQYVITYKQ